MRWKTATTRWARCSESAADSELLDPLVAHVGHLNKPFVIHGDAAGNIIGI